MPTRDEFEELCNRDNCDMNRTSLNGWDGWFFISKKNGNSIFIPEAGYFEGLYLGMIFSYGNYWSSSLNKYISYRNQNYAIYFQISKYYSPCTSAYPFYRGLPVRPVSE